ncbi:hypothetical protein BDW72DRAFT_177930 [Aspergillus terricola var. indicus]
MIKLMATIAAAAATPTPIPAFAPVESEFDGFGSTVFVAAAVNESALVEMEGVKESFIVVVLMVAAVDVVP